MHVLSILSVYWFREVIYLFWEFNCWFRKGQVTRQVYFKINYIHTLLDHRCLIAVIILIPFTKVNPHWQSNISFLSVTKIPSSSVPSFSSPSWIKTGLQAPLKVLYFPGCPAARVFPATKRITATELCLDSIVYTAINTRLCKLRVGLLLV